MKRLVIEQVVLYLSILLISGCLSSDGGSGGDSESKSKIDDGVDLGSDIGGHYIVSCGRVSSTHAGCFYGKSDKNGRVTKQDDSFTTNPSNWQMFAYDPNSDKTQITLAGAGDLGAFWHVVFPADDAQLNGWTGFDVSVAMGSYKYSAKVPASFRIWTTPRSGEDISWDVSENAVGYAVELFRTPTCEGAGESLPATGPGIVANIQPGQYWACVYAWSSTGGRFASPDNPWSFVKMQNVSGSGVVTVNGIPNGISKDTDLTIWIGGVGAYRYVVKPSNDSSICYNTDIGQYSGWNNVDTALDLDISSMADGPVSLCLHFRNSNGVEWSSRNRFSWTKDTTPPSPFDHTPIAPFNPAFNAPLGRYEFTEAVSGSSDPDDDFITLRWNSVETHHYQLVLSTYPTCEVEVVTNWTYITGDSQKIYTHALATGLKTYYLCLSAVDQAGNVRKATTSSIPLVVTAKCPPHFLFIAGTDTEPPFCVMKYEAADPCPAYTTAEACQAQSFCTWTTTGGCMIAGAPPSGPSTEAGNRPINSLGYCDAVRACEGISVSGYTGVYHLITNGQWQRVAWDIESVARNWFSGDPSSNNAYLNTGHSIRMSDFDVPYPADTNDNIDCSGYPPASFHNNHICNGHFEKRTHFLSSTEEPIWDLSGNLEEWVHDPIVTGTPYPDTENHAISQIYHWSPLPSASQILKWGPKLDHVSKPYWGGLGLYAPLLYTPSAWAVRGNAYGCGSSCGIFAVRYNTMANGGLTGFRCVYEFPPATQLPKPPECP